MNDIIRLSVKEIISNNVASNPKTGFDVHEVVTNALNRFKTVELSFADIVYVGDAWLNSAIGMLLENFSKKELDERLLLTDAKPIIQSKFKNTLIRAAVYYEGLAKRMMVEKINSITYRS